MKTRTSLKVSTHSSTPNGMDYANGDAAQLPCADWYRSRLCVYAFKTIGKAVVCVIGSWLSALTASGQSLPNLFPLPNATGLLETYNTANGPIDLTGPFFQSLGTNGRSCGPVTGPVKVGVFPQRR